MTKQEAKLWLKIRVRVVNIRNEALAGAKAEMDKDAAKEHAKLRQMLLKWTRPR
jgi:hypothetical protein